MNARLCRACVSVLALIWDQPFEYVVADPRASQPTVLGTPTKVTDPYPQVEGLIGLDDGTLAKFDIATINIACAIGLPGFEVADLGHAPTMLDRWAEHVGHETERNLYQFRKNPANYENSESYFRILVMITALQLDLGVRYSPRRIREVDFTESRELFLHGLLNGHGGTCVSMPVLYVAVGRRLGYPLKLVSAKGHMFARWDDPTTGERLNIEGSGRGLNTYPDEYYRTWPYPISDTEMASGYYLRSMSPREELAAFLATRGHCLWDNHRKEEATQTYKWASEIVPGYLGFYRSALAGEQRDGKFEVPYGVP